MGASLREGATGSWKGQKKQRKGLHALGWGEDGWKWRENGEGRPIPEKPLAPVFYLSESLLPEFSFFPNLG